MSRIALPLFLVCVLSLSAALFVLADVTLDANGAATFAVISGQTATHGIIASGDFARFGDANTKRVTISVQNRNTKECTFKLEAVTSQGSEALPDGAKLLSPVVGYRLSLVKDESAKEQCETFFITPSITYDLELAGTTIPDLTEGTNWYASLQFDADAKAYTTAPTRPPIGGLANQVTVNMYWRSGTESAVVYFGSLDLSKPIPMVFNYHAPIFAGNKLYNYLYANSVFSLDAVYRDTMLALTLQVTSDHLSFDTEKTVVDENGATTKSVPLQYLTFITGRGSPPDANFVLRAKIDDAYVKEYRVKDKTTLRFALYDPDAKKWKIGGTHDDATNELTLEVDSLENASKFAIVGVGSGKPIHSGTAQTGRSVLAVALTFLSAVALLL